MLAYLKNQTPLDVIDVLPQVGVPKVYSPVTGQCKKIMHYPVAILEDQHINMLLFICHGLIQKGITFYGWFSRFWIKLWKVDTAADQWAAICEIIVDRNDSIKIIFECNMQIFLMY